MPHQSEQQDSNLRPLAPKASALTRLSYVPKCPVGALRPGPRPSPPASWCPLSYMPIRGLEPRRSERARRPKRRVYTIPPDRRSAPERNRTSTSPAAHRPLKPACLPFHHRRRMLALGIEPSMSETTALQAATPPWGMTSEYNAPAS